MRISLRLLLSLSLFIALFCCAGCSRPHQTFLHVKDPASVLYKSGSLDGKQPEMNWKIQLAHFAGESNQIDRLKDLRTEYNESTDSAEKLRLLQQIVRPHLNHIAHLHEAFRLSIQLRVAGGRTLFDVTNLGLTFASTVTGGEAAKTLLSAIATLMTGAELSLTENYLNNQTAVALMSEMKAVSNVERLRIEEALKDPNYTIEQADEDLTRYLASGSIVNAILSLAEQASKRERKTSDALEKAKPGGEAALEKLNAVN